MLLITSSRRCREEVGAFPKPTERTWLDTANKQHARWSRPRSTTTTCPTVRLQGGNNKCATGVKTMTRLPKEGTTVGTGNIHSPHACGKVQELTHELKCYQWDILGLAKVRWKVQSRQHPLWAAYELRHGNTNSNSPDSDMLGDERMAKGVDTIAHHTFAKERQPQAMSELSYHQPSQQDHALS